jgi:acetyl-CoA carboxylase carboxyl transferase subunit beta
MSSRIDVSIEHRNVPEPPGTKHPNTCPECESHYRDDELEAALWVCPQCGYHFPMRARSRIASLADAGSFVEEASDLRSEDPLHFFDLRPYTERLAEAEMKTGREAMVTGKVRSTEGLASSPHGLFMGGPMGSVGGKAPRACDSAAERRPLVSVTAWRRTHAGGDPSC